MDKRPEVRPVGIVETLLQDITKLVMRAAVDQVKTAYRSLQLCAGLEADIELKLVTVLRIAINMWLIMA